MPDKESFDKFISQFPVYEYRLIPAQEISAEPRVREVCRQECERYGSTWACPPAVGALSECEKKIRSYSGALLFSSVAEVSDVLNFDETLPARKEHERLTDRIGKYLIDQGEEILILSTESCDLCEDCTYPQGLPCRLPGSMHPCLESYGVVVSALAQKYQMEFSLGGNTILWFSLILFRGKDNRKKENV